MYAKLIFASVLIAFACVQLASSLDCYTCNQESKCSSLSKTQCSPAAANTTLAQLKGRFPNVVNTTSTGYQCLRFNQTQGNQVTLDIRGCVYQNPNTCGSIGAGNCTLCNGNLCNPAGTVSSSTFTIASTILVAILAKFFAH